MVVVGLLVGLALAAVPQAAGAQQLVFVVRHAERADGGAAGGAMATPADPPLSAAGEARAAKLATMLADAGIKAIYSTEFRRTQDTAKPLAQRLGMTVETVAAREAAALVERVKASHAADVVFIVGHSNTVPAIIKAFGGPAVEVGDDEYDSLFVIVPATGALTRIRY
jgi:broad specificity phosphatase PhoE